MSEFDHCRRKEEPTTFYGKIMFMNIELLEVTVARDPSVGKTIKLEADIVMIRENMKSVKKK